MKIIFISIAMAFIGLQTLGQTLVTVKGTVKGDTKGYNEVYVYGSGIKTDTAKIINGQFEFKIPYTHPIAPLFYTEYDAKIKKAVSPFPIVIGEPGMVKLNDVIIEKGLYTCTLSGIRSAEEYQTFSKLKGGAAEVKSFAKLHPKSFTTIYLLNRMRASLGEADLEAIYQQIDKTVKQTKEGIAVGQYLAGLKSSATGKTIKDFTLNDAGDQPFSFSTLRGKYVIIDFWASWCGPCIASFPHMKEIYEKYKGNKFEIYSISIDESKTAWLQKLTELELPWSQALDTKNIAGGQFGVSAVPTTFLIDPQGKILLKELGFKTDGTSKVEMKLRELLQENKSR